MEKLGGNKNDKYCPNKFRYLRAYLGAYGALPPPPLAATRLNVALSAASHRACAWRSLEIEGESPPLF
jgi:hypothetical protein